MPWCPVCKMEYVEGMTICPDCNKELIPDNPDDHVSEKKMAFSGEPALAKRVLDFLIYCGIQTAELSNEESEEELEAEPKTRLSVSKEEYAETIKHIGVFLTEERSAREEPEESKSDPSKTTPHRYVKKSVQYEDLHSSGMTLLAVGGAGIVFFILNIAGVLHFSFSSNILFYLVMGVIFVFFVVMGAITLSRAAKVKTQIAEEEQATEDILQWFLETYTPDDIDLACADIHENTPDEARYFSRSAYIKHELDTKLEALDEAYLDALAEQLYEKLYEI